VRLVLIDTKTGEVTDFQTGKKVPKTQLSSRTKRMSNAVKMLIKSSKEGKG